MLISGLGLLAIMFIGLWLCMAGKDGKVKSFLRGGLDIMASIAITAGLGVGIAMIVVGLGDKAPSQLATCPFRKSYSRIAMVQFG